MLPGPIFERFRERGPVSVMARGAIEHALAAGPLDALFDRRARRRYTRDVLFSSLVDLMALVVAGVRESVHAAYQASPEQLGVSLTAVYNKRRGIEPGLSAELVRHAAAQPQPVPHHPGGTAPAWVPGYRARLLGGNRPAATRHRPAGTRAHAAAPLPGRALVVFDPALGLVTDVFPCEGGHARERPLVADVVARLAALFVFGVALAAADVLALIEGALRAAHGTEQAAEVSGYYLGDEIAGTQRGMTSAIPAGHGLVFGGLTAVRLAEVLGALAGRVRLTAFRRHRRGPKKAPVKRRYGKKHPHVSTAQLLEKRRHQKTDA